jgi:hypothetical protein
MVLGNDRWQVAYNKIESLFYFLVSVWNELAFLKERAWRRIN